MADNPRIRVPGYAQRVFFNDGIEYRNFSPDLVGNQLTSEGGLPLFTMGNFSVTTNLDPSISIRHNTGAYGQFYDLSTLNVDDSEVTLLLNDNATARLNLDDRSLLGHAYFGSLTEFIRVNLEEIITNWVASIYMSPIVTLPSGIQTTGYTLTNYLYDPNTNTSTFNVPHQTIVNNYELNYLVSGSILNTFNEGNDLRNMTVNYLRYSVLNNSTEYPVLGFTGLTTAGSGDLRLLVTGDPFSTTGSSVNQFVTYHIKPNKAEGDKFFNNLNDFQSSLLNTIIKPKYTVTFRYPIESDDGIILFQTTKLRWTTTDGYNLDFNTTEYVEYVNKLIELAEATDLSKSDLIVRFLTSDSISEFDTIPHCDGSEEETAAQKVTKTLRVYGREFDEIKRYIDGIAFANVVTYDKRDNTPDLVLKNLARIMGWDLVSTILENNLLANYVTTPRASFSGQSRGLTPIEAEYEMWRRLIMNTPWIWKSKGQRKVIEFLIKFIGAPDGLMEFNEHVYVVKKPLDVELFKEVLRLNFLDTNLALYNIDNDGFPVVRPNTPDMYFQKGGGWYRETGGENAGKYILDGNNPHSGAYDRGQAFINQFRGLIPNFDPVTVTATTVTTDSAPLFTNYNQGLINNYTGNTYVDLSSQDYYLENCVTLNTYIIEDPNPTAEVTECGCDIETNDDSIQIDISFSASTIDCPTLYPELSFNAPYNYGYSGVTEGGYYIFQYPLNDINGNPASPAYYNSPYINPECCNTVTGDGMPVEYVDINVFTLGGQPINITPLEVVETYGVNGGLQRGSICCKVDQYGEYENDCVCFATCNWRLTGSTFESNTVIVDGNTYLRFVTPTGEYRVGSPDGCNCAAPTNKIPVTDPYTGVEGVGCQIDANTWYQSGTSLIITNTYQQRFNGDIGCSDVYIIPTTIPGQESDGESG